MNWLKSVLGKAEKKPPVSISDGNFRREVKQYRGAVLLDIWGPSCGSCDKLVPIIQELSTEFHGRVKVCEMNAATAPRTAGAMGVRSTPTTIAFKDGAEIGRIVGWKPLSFWKELIETEFEDYVSGAIIPQEAQKPSAAAATGQKPNKKAAKKAAKKARRNAS